jgi:hypothetical protein
MHKGKFMTAKRRCWPKLARVVSEPHGEASCSELWLDTNTETKKCRLLTSEQTEQFHFNLIGR